MYPIETLDHDVDNGTMPENVAKLSESVVGHRIVKVEKIETVKGYYRTPHVVTAVTLDNGKMVELTNGGDCCAYTELKAFLLHPDKIDHIITGVGTTDGYTTWHIYADAGDVLTLTVDWSCGNPFYYGYGFDIQVKELS